MMYKGVMKLPFIVLFGGAAILTLSLLGLIVWVAWHFISKLW